MLTNRSFTINNLVWKKTEDGYQCDTHLATFVLERDKSIPNTYWPIVRN